LPHLFGGPRGLLHGPHGPLLVQLNALHHHNLDLGHILSGQTLAQLLCAPQAEQEVQKELYSPGAGLFAREKTRESGGRVCGSLSKKGWGFERF